ncbi:acylphosphatase [Chitinophagaceae bacterium MMS25-I14]
MITKKLLIEGKVQGVFYRASAQEKAHQLGITGWARNSTDGHVEILVHGPAAQVEAFIKWCHHGPEGAVVTHIHSSDTDEAAGEGFRIVK